MITDLIIRYGYVMLVAGVIVEGDATLVAAAVLAHRGHFRLSTVMVLAAVTSLIMNQFYFRLGRRQGIKRVAKMDGHRLFRNIAHHTRKHAIWLVLLSRFVFGFRMAIPMTVGALGMTMTRFLVADLFGALIWSVTLGAAGYAAGHAGELLLSNLRNNEWAVAGVLIVLTLAWGVYRRRHVQEVTTLLDRTDILA